MIPNTRVLVDKHTTGVDRCNWAITITMGKRAKPSSRTTCSSLILINFSCPESQHSELRFGSGWQSRRRSRRVMKSSLACGPRLLLTPLLAESLGTEWWQMSSTGGSNVIIHRHKVSSIECNTSPSMLLSLEPQLVTTFIVTQCRLTNCLYTCI